METRYICSNCRKEVDFLAEGEALCETCKANLPTAKFNSRVKKTRD